MFAGYYVTAARKQTKHSRRNSLMKIFTAAIAGAVLIGGISVGAEALKKDDSLENLKQVQVAPSSDHKGISLPEAAEIALSKVENGVVKEAEKNREKGRLVYEIDIKNDDYEYEFKVDAQTGEIVKNEKDERDGKKFNKAAQANSGEAKKEAVISIGEAKDIALKEVSGKIDDIELERENGQLVYEVEIETEQHGDDDDVTVYVDAVTGKVLYVEWDD
jgi:uncharacterized membrane protein YkoI